MTQHLPSPVITYHLPHLKDPIDRDDAIWSSFLPESRDYFSERNTETTGGGIRYGDYFTGLRTFIERNRFKAIIDAGSRQLGRQLKANELKEVRICLEKHGEYYHPARLDVAVAGGRFALVASAAFSEPGQTAIKNDFVNMDRLNRQFPYSFLPDVYCEDRVGLGSGLPKMRICLGQWLDGYNEFHLTRRSTSKAVEMVVWDPQRGNFYLSENQRLNVYRQAAMILTAYYNLETTEQAFAWHHAAGDFVLALENASGGIDLKLITVRKYAPLIDNNPAPPEAIFQALLLFLLNMTIRMRLDRLDGVAEMVWADDHSVAATVKGFFQGLTLQSRGDIIPAGVPALFHAYLKDLSAEDAFDLLASMVAQMPSGSPELSLIKTHVRDHAAALHRAIQARPDAK